jgi:hemoglobin-like flavoprotein
MITINPVKLNTPVTFGNNTPNTAILALQDPGAKIKFKENYNKTKDSDAVHTNIFTAIGCKFAKAIDVLKTPSNTIDPVYAKHISFMA